MSRFLAGDPPLPRYAEASLSELIPSVLGAFGLPGFVDGLGIAPGQPLSGACVLVADGLGWEALLDHPAEAPFLNGLAQGGGRAITAGFPATTTASLGSIGTGLPPGRHGLVGYSIGMPGYERPINLLSWGLAGPGSPTDLREEVVPEEFQPERTAFERAKDHGVEVILLGARDHARSGLTRAVLRGGSYEGIYSLGDLAASAADALAAGPRSLVYAYHPNLDVTGHMRGVGSESWALELANVDALAQAIAERLIPGTALVVTGDHGMVDLRDDQKVDVADRSPLLEGVRLLAGEPRARYAYAVPGAASDVLATWREMLGERMWVVGRDDAVAAGWFGPAVPDRVRPRIGDVIAAARGPIGLFDRRLERFMVDMVGHHGSLTPAEQLVPLLVLQK